MRGNKEFIVTRKSFANKGKGLSTAINRIIKENNMEYFHNDIISSAYIGEGFYVNSQDLGNAPIKTYGYDVHWAYGGTLLNNKFPLSSYTSPNKTELGIQEIMFDNFKHRYNDYDYTLFLKSMWKDKNKKYHFRATTLDVEILKDMYILENVKLVNETYFEDIGEMPEELKKLVRECYKIKKQGITDEEKTALEASFYGKFATCYSKYEKLNGEKYKVFHKALEETGYPEIRDKRTPIAMFQAAYQRHREWQQFKKHINDGILYMNTDSIMFDNDVKIETGNDIGEWGNEYNGEEIFYIRRNAYIVLDDKGNIKKRVLGGIINPEVIGKKELKMLASGQPVMCKAWTDKQHTKMRDITLEPSFYKEYYY